MYFNVEPTAEPALIPLEEVPTAVIRHRGVVVTDLPGLFDDGYQAVQRSGASLADPAIALYQGDPEASFDLELGFPVTGPLPAGSAPVEESVLPAGRAVWLTAIGPYDALPQAWARVVEAATGFGIAADCFCEVYVSDPDVVADHSSLRTDLFLIESSR